MKKISRKYVLAVLLAVSLAVFSGCIGVQTPKPDTTSPESKDASWCQKGYKYDAQTPQGKVTWETMGVTVYNDREVCMSQWTSADGTYTQYVSQDGKYMHQIMKNSTGDIVYEGGQELP